MKKTPKTSWAPPAGISYYPRQDTPAKPYWLSWRIGMGKRRAEGYATEKDREVAARALAGKLSEYGASVVLTFDPIKWRRWLEFERVVGVGIDPLIVAAEWKAVKQGRSSSLVGMWIKEAVDKYLELRKAERTWGRDAERHAEKQLRQSFVERYPTKRVNEITADDIRCWMTGLKLPGGEPMAATTQKDYRKNLATFFDYAVREGWVQTNPVRAIRPPRIEEEDVYVASVREVFEFFKINREARCIGRVALEAFGGVRYSTAGRIGKDSLNFEQAGIRMQGRLHKSGKTRYRQGHPENLWAWLKHAPDSCWEMTALQYREEKRMAAIKSGLRPASGDTKEGRDRFGKIANVWRHSFASYHLARYNQAYLTQRLMQHSSSKTTEVYEGVADETDAARYFMITPETALLSWEQFLRLPTI